jgi:hypothetical protein
MMDPSGDIMVPMIVTMIRAVQVLPLILYFQIRHMAQWR